MIDSDRYKADVRATLQMKITVKENFIRLSEDKFKSLYANHQSSF